MSAETLAERADRIAQSAEREANALAQQDRLREAKSVLSDAQRDLRDLKRDLADEQRAIRDAAIDQRDHINGSGQLVGMFGGSKARGAMSRGRAMAKRDLSRHRTEALRPYDAVKATIDRYIAAIDRARAQIADALASSGRTSASVSTQPHPSPRPMPSPGAPPAGFYPDPKRRRQGALLGRPRMDLAAPHVVPRHLN